MKTNAKSTPEIRGKSRTRRAVVANKVAFHRLLLLVVLLGWFCVAPRPVRAQSFPAITLDGALPQKTFVLDTPHSKGQTVRVGVISTASWQALQQLAYLPAG